MKLLFDPYVFPSINDYPELYKFPEKGDVMTSDIREMIIELERNYQMDIYRIHKDHQERLRDMAEDHRMELLILQKKGRGK